MTSVRMTALCPGIALPDGNPAPAFLDRHRMRVPVLDLGDDVHQLAAEQMREVVPFQQHVMLVGSGRGRRLPGDQHQYNWLLVVMPAMISWRRWHGTRVGHPASAAVRFHLMRAAVYRRSPDWHHVALVMIMPSPRGPVKRTMVPRVEVPMCEWASGCGRLWFRRGHGCG